MDIDLTIRDMTGKSFTFKRVQEARSFIEAELQYWPSQRSRFGGKLPRSFEDVIVNFKELLSALNRLEEIGVSEPGEYKGSPAWQSFRTASENIVNWLHQRWIYRGTPFTEAWLSAYEHSNDAGDSFFIGVHKKYIEYSRNPPPMDSFAGYLMAYEYLLQDQSDLVKRRGAEKKSFNTLRNDLEKERDHLLSETNEFRQSLEAWRNGTQEAFTEWLDSSRHRSDETIKNHSLLFNQMADHAKNRVAELEGIYKEKLRLEGPATYWASRARSLGIQGGFWAVMLALVSIVATVGAGCFFWGWLQREPLPFGLASLQGVALFGATAAAALFLIRTLSKLTFSAFHLQRDAEEREQLTHLYLALVNEGALDTSSRDIVLQALFSRADTGLLAGDHSPTMPSPGDVVAGISRIKPQ